MSSQPRITVKTIHIPPSDPSLPAFALQVTELVDSYMLWIGATDITPDNVSEASQQGNLSRDWACAMPPLPGRSNGSTVTVPATSLYRSSSSDIALPMAQRLAKRFQKQIFLSVDVPSAILSIGQGHKVLFDMEKSIVGTLKEMEGERKPTTTADDSLESLEYN